MFKKKGSWKKLDNYRGIFTVTILQLIYEKVCRYRTASMLYGIMVFKMIPFIYLFSKNASISINTPLGRTDPFVLENLVKQDTVLGPVLNSCSLDRVPEEGSRY